jgi:hypothetical protein
MSGGDRSGGAVQVGGDEIISPRRHGNTEKSKRGVAADSRRKAQMKTARANGRAASITLVSISLRIYVTNRLKGGYNIGPRGVRGKKD